MAAYFFDSSAVVKRYVNEQGSAWVAATADPNAGAHVYVAAVTGVEVVATFARKLKGNLITAADASAAVSRFHHDFANEYRIIDFTPVVLSRSMTMAETHALRGYDAVQLASAVEINRRRVALGAATMTFVTNDSELLTAAAAEGLLTDDPNTH